MTSAYYEEQAQEYDNFDLTHPTRQAYTTKIEKLISEDLKKNFPNTRHLLSIACGTGRRAINIRKQSGLDYQITGVDLSPKMCALAEQKGIQTIQGQWTKVSVPEDQRFDAATCLYAFGHMPDKAERIDFLQKLARYLQKGAPFYLDVFNINDKNEWGPSARQKFRELNLDEAGYEEGDVFYKKSGGQAIAFLHYFDEKEIIELLENNGFQLEDIIHIGYVKKSGQRLSKPDEGALFIKTTKAS